jgi:hypothetical protein
MTNMAVAARPPGVWRRLLAGLLHELRLIVPPTLYFLVGFNLILFTKRLILAEYLIEFSGFMLAAVSALVVGKVVLVADMMPFLRRFDDKPLVQPVLFKTIVYTALVFVARLLEDFVRFLLAGGATDGFLHHLLMEFSWYQFAATQIWIFVLFLIYVAAAELGALFPDGELPKILFKRRSSGPEPT